MAVTSLIVGGDSLSYGAAYLWYQLCGIAAADVGGEFLEPLGGSAQASRYLYTVAGSNPVLLMTNTAISGTRLFVAPGGNNCSATELASARVDAVIPASYPGTLTNGLPDNRPLRNYLLCVFYSNMYTNDPATYATDMAAYFAARKSAAAAKGVTLRCGTITIPSRTEVGGFTTETLRHTFNNTYLRDAGWRTTNGIYVADLASVPELDATNAADNATEFVDQIHWSGVDGVGASRAVPVVRSMLNAMIAGTAP